MFAALGWVLRVFVWFHVWEWLQHAFVPQREHGNTGAKVGAKPAELSSRFLAFGHAAALSTCGCAYVAALLSADALPEVRAFGLAYLVFDVLHSLRTHRSNESRPSPPRSPRSPRRRKRDPHGDTTHQAVSNDVESSTQVLNNHRPRRRWSSNQGAPSQGASTNSDEETNGGRKHGGTSMTQGQGTSHVKRGKGRGEGNRKSHSNRAVQHRRESSRGTTTHASMHSSARAHAHGRGRERALSESLQAPLRSGQGSESSSSTAAMLEATGTGTAAASGRAHPLGAILHHVVTTMWLYGFLLIDADVGTVIYGVSEIPIMLLNWQWLLSYHGQSHTRMHAALSGLAVVTYLLCRIVLFFLAFLWCVVPNLALLHPWTYIALFLQGVVYLLQIAWFCRLLRKNAHFLPPRLTEMLLLVALPHYTSSSASASAACGPVLAVGQALVPVITDSLGLARHKVGRQQTSVPPALQHAASALLDRFFANNAVAVAGESSRNTNNRDGDAWQKKQPRPRPLPSFTSDPSSSSSGFKTIHTSSMDDDDEDDETDASSSLISSSSPSP